MARSAIARCLDPNRRVWGRSLLLAVGLHLSLATAFLGWAGLGPPVTGSLCVSPVAQATIVPAEPAGVAPVQRPGERETAPGLTGEAGPPPADVTLTERSLASDAELSIVPSVAAEPDDETIRGLLEGVTAAASRPADPRARDELLRQAAILQQISNPEEVSRMAAAIREALGIDVLPPRAPSAIRSGSIDLDQCLLTDISREDDGDTARIREILVDPSGVEVILETSRTIEPRTGEAKYEQRLLEPGQVAVAVATTQEEFDAALARYQPFEIINRFPLVKQLHRQAVLPLLGMLAGQTRATSRPAGPAETQRATDRDGPAAP